MHYATTLDEHSRRTISGICWRGRTVERPHSRIGTPALCSSSRFLAYHLGTGRAENVLVRSDKMESWAPLGLGGTNPAAAGEPEKPASMDGDCAFGQMVVGQAFLPPSLERVKATHARLMSNGLVRTPLVKLNKDIVLMREGECPQKIEIYLKLECNQHCRTFKTRGALNYLLEAEPSTLQNGLVTPSVGSFGQALAYCASKLGGIPNCTVLLPDLMDRFRGELLDREYPVRVCKLPFDLWWFAIQDRAIPDGAFGREDPVHQAHFVHPATPSCSAGDATIALEILEDLPDVDAVVVPYCTGSFSCGISNVLAELKPSVKLHPVEVSTSTPLHSAMNAGRPSRCNHTPTFVDQIGGQNVLPFMWDSVQNAPLADPLMVTQDDIVHAICTLKESNDIIAEGAGAAPLAAALTGKAGPGKVVCVVTGGNIDPEFLRLAMTGVVPAPRF